MNKALSIFKNALPILIMVGIIPFISNDYLLTAVFVAIILVAFAIRKEKNEIAIFIFGFCIMIVSEYLFISLE